MVVLVCLPKGAQAMPTRGPNKNLALFSPYTDVPTTGCVSSTPLEPKTKFDATPLGEFQPLLNSWRTPRVTVRLGRSDIASCAYHAPAHCRHPISMGLSVATTCVACPCMKCCRSANVAIPLLWSAALSFDCTRCSHVPTLI